MAMRRPRSDTAGQYIKLCRFIDLDGSDLGEQLELLRRPFGCTVMPS